MNTVGERYFDVEVGQRLRAARLSAGWSQTRLAKHLSITFQQIQKYETGVNRLPANRYPALAEAIGFNVTDLLTGRLDVAERSSARPSSHELRLIFDQLSDVNQAKLVSYAKGLMNSE